MTPRAAARAAAHSATTATAIRRAALALILAATLLAGGMLAGPRPSSADGTLTADSVAITSSAASGNDYHAGETLIATVTFSGPITSHTGASLAIVIGANTRTVTLDDVASGLNTTTLDFPYVVTSVDEDTNGVTVAASGALAGTYGHAGHTGNDHVITAITAGLTAQAANTVNTTPTVDYDTDDDRLIEVDSLAKLDAIRYNLSGNGNPTGADAAAHNDVFPRPMPYHGCPDTDDADSDPNPCLGYELTANLDFDYNENGGTHTGGVIDSGDAVAATAAYFDSTTGWNPIGGHANTGGTFSGAFEGNNRTISNLYINLDTSATDDGRNVGLFGKTSGALRNLGLVNPYVKNTRSGGGTLIYFGALSGASSGAVSRSYVDGGQVIGGQQSTGGTNIDIGGCLLGNASGTVSDSYATCAVTATTGDNGQVGGLIGYVEGTVRRSYANGTVTSDFRAGGLLGGAGSSSISDSYATGAVSVSTSNSDAGGLVGWTNSGSSFTNSYATGNVSADSSSDVGGLVGDTAASNVRVIGSYATGNVSTTGGSNNIGGLVGRLRQSGAVIGSYATGNVSTAGNSNNMGGLVGRLLSNGSLIRASYATGSVSATGNSNTLGGLAGQINVGTSITASYAIGSVSTTGTGATLGGLVASAVGAATVTNSYWDSTTSTQASSPGGGITQTTSNLQMPTEYGTSPSIYENWNVDADNVSGNDDPWDFGTSSQYPILKFGQDAVSIARQRGVTITRVDYDTDNDNLIDITTLGQLNGIRYDLDGNGRTTGADSIGYLAAFPGVSRDMGCPATCIGYELMDDLDFDYDEDGSTHTSGTIDPGDAVAATAAYFDSVTGWTPIGGHTSSAAPYTAIFEGNGNTIDNLYINLTTTSATDSVYVGLFADIGKAAGTSPVTPAQPGVVRNLGLVDPYVLNTRSGAANPFTTVRTGALAGRNSGGGTVSGSWVSGGAVNGTQNTTAETVYNYAGCLLGYNGGTVTAAYNATCATTATGSDDANDEAGGLIGWNQGAVSRSYATGTVASDFVGGGLIGENTTSAGAVVTSYATGAVTVSGANGRAGGLVGQAGNRGSVAASYAKGAVTASGAGANSVGGLIGHLVGGGAVTASYAAEGAVSASNNASGVTNRVGGLVGRVEGGTTTITASYATGAVTGAGTGGATDSLGGLVGTSGSTGAVTNSHWNSDATGGTGQSASAGGDTTVTAKTGAQLIAPTDYGATSSATFYSWNVDLDGDSSADDPWDFGTTTQYPVLSYGGISLRAQGRTPVDYDADNDGLIDIDTLAKLNAVRHDLDGNGQHDGGAGDTAYNAVFANRDRSAAGLMGCPLADHDDDADTPNQAHCTGYELVADLTFDTDASGGIAAGDDYWNSGAGWVPIIDSANADTGYSGVFEGNRHTIDYLFIDLAAAAATPLDVGLFGELDRGGVIRGVGLTNVSISRTVGNDGGIYAGALAGQNFGAITASSAAGSVSATDTSATSSYAGGLVGQNGNGGVIAASYADVAVAVNSLGVRAGGLAGHNLGGAITASHAMGAVTATDSGGVSAIGGLVGANSPIGSGMGAVPATITASYATGAVSGAGTAIGVRLLGGLIGGGTGGTVTASYWDTTTTGITGLGGGGTGYATAALQTPTEYGSATTTPPSIYANWNVDVDGDGTNDDPWHFGTASQYPTLKYGGFSPAAQGSAGMDYDTDSDGLIEITTLAQLDAIRYDLDGNGRPTSVHAYRSAFPIGDVGSDAEMGDAGRMGCSHSEPVVRTCLGYELMSDLDFDTDGDGRTHTAGVGDPGDDYYNAGAGWAPIGGHDANAQAYTAIFNGNDNDIENLYLNLDTSAADAGVLVGLFADLTGTVRNVGLANPYVKNARSGGGLFVRTGALAGRNNVGGTVRDSSVTGGSVTGDQSAGTPISMVGCLLGYNAGAVRDSSASCAATATGAEDSPSSRDQAGGLVGENAAIEVNSVTGAGLIANSHATGNVTADRVAGGLVGDSTTGGRVTGSYAEGDVTATGANGRAGGLLGRIRAGTDVSDSYAIGDVRVSGSNSIAGGLVGKAQNAGTTVTGSYATGAVTASGAGVRNLPNQLGNLLGGLVGELTTGAQITASYATGAVTATAAADNSILGGLVGHMSEADTLVLAAYATGSVTANGGGTNNVGGLLGELDDIENNIDSSYAIGAVSATGIGAGVVNSVGGLVGALISPALASQVANSYYDNTADGAGLMVSPGGGSGQTTTALQTPVGYTGIYSAWNRDLDNADTDDDLTTGADDPWDFGTDGEYPVLIYGALSATGQGRTLVDYDTDNDGLIDITTLAQLDAVRHDLDGNGHPASNAPDYRSAYPNRDGSAAGRMGCPAGACTGYELRDNLDFDTSGDGMVNASDDYPNWTPIADTVAAPYTANFNGNGHTIARLTINATGQFPAAGNYTGLFGYVSGDLVIENVGLTDVDITVNRTRSSTTLHYGGALIGFVRGKVRTSYATGTLAVTASGQTTSLIGGLIGRVGGTSAGVRGELDASWANVNTTLTSTSSAANEEVGGLVGGLYGHTSSRGAITASYARGAVTVSDPNRIAEGGLAGRVSNSSVTASYWDTDKSTQSSSAGGAGKTTAELQEPAGYTGIYADWNIDVDGDATTGDDQGQDDPWDFRLGHYPILKYGGFDTAPVNPQRPLLAEAGAGAEAYSGQTVTLDGSGRSLSSAALTYMWTQVDDGDEGDPTVELARNDTASLTFTAPTGLTRDATLVFRLTVTAGGRSVYDEVTVSIVAVRPNQLLSLTLTDSEGDAVGLAPPFVSLRYDYAASVPNQIASVTITPGILSGSTMTLNGQAATSGAAVEIPLKYRGNQITIIVTPPEPEPSETTDGETTDGETTDETAAETPCSVENNGVKPCTYTVTVNRAVPPRLAFVPRSLTIEEGSTGTYTVELDTRILTGAVTIAIASDNPDVTVSPTEVTLKPLDMAPRTITVTAASDSDRNDETAVITHTANGAHYYDVIATVAVKVNDATAPPPEPDPALSVSATALRLAEGGSGAYTVALATQPDNNVTVTIASDNADVTTRPAALSFTTANWNTAQRVTVSAASDGDTANDTATLTHTASGGGYADAPAVSVTVSVTDDDTAGLSITPTVLNLIENGISAYIVSLTAQPSGNVTVSIASDNPDVTVRPTALTFTPSNWDTPQAVLVIARADDGGGDELATLRMTARGGGYAGQTGQVLASVDDTLAPLPAGSITTSPDAPAGVSVYGPPGTTARATVSPPADDTPTVATGAGFGIGSAVAVSVSDAPDDGLEICLPVSDALRAEVNSALILTLLRYAGGAWTELSGARDLGDRVCAAGVTGQAAYAAAYALPPGTVLDLAASVGDTPGTIALSWTPPAAGASQVAVVVNIADDTDYCLDTLPGLDASSYTCAGRTAGQTYVALLIVLLPDGGYTLANIVRFDLPAAGGQ